MHLSSVKYLDGLDPFNKWIILAMGQIDPFIIIQVEPTQLINGSFQVKLTRLMNGLSYLWVRLGSTI